MSAGASKGVYRGLKAVWNLRKTIPLIIKLLFDERVKKRYKVTFCAVTLGYLAFPYDFIFDLPFWGQLDDLVIFIFMINWLIKRIPEDILRENGWEPEED